MAFDDTDNKRCVRSLWDGRILRNWHSRVKHRLTYFGMPGPEILDLLDWHDVLDERRTAVEWLGRTKAAREQADRVADRINLNAFLHGITSGLQTLRENVETIIISGLDKNNDRPQINDGAPAVTARFGYDVVNLDFVGGLGSDLRRTEALRKLCERQRGADSILLMTLNVRTTLQNQIDNEFAARIRRINNSHIRRALEWHAQKVDGLHAFRIKGVVPLIVSEYASVVTLEAKCYPPIMYWGKDAMMIHFAFELTRSEGTLTGQSAQSLEDLLALPMLVAENGALTFGKRQLPGLDNHAIESSLTFLDDALRSALMSTLPASSGERP